MDEEDISQQCYPMLQQQAMDEEKRLTSDFFKVESSLFSSRDSQSKNAARGYVGGFRMVSLGARKF